MRHSVEIARLQTAIQAKADRTDLIALQARVTPLEAAAEDAKAVTAWKTKIQRNAGWLVAAVLVPLGGTFAGLYLAH